MRRLPSWSSSLARQLALAAVAVLAACGPNRGDGDDDGPAPDGGPDPIDASTEQCRRMDLVFVVDDSGSMEEEQVNLAGNFPMFASVLNEYRVATGEQLDYRAGVTTTGITANFEIVIPAMPPLIPSETRLPQSQSGADGKFRAGCGSDRPWLERTDPNMATTFACRARVGTGGPAIEMPLRAAELAVSDAVNPGFVRDDALLGVVIITDEDDCSRRSIPFETRGDECATNGDTDLATVTSFVSGFDQRKGDRGRWATAVIAGPSDCMSDFGAASDAIRLKQFVNETGATAAFGDICQGNLAPALQQALDTFQAACENFPPIGRRVPD
jgi:hypothetical protein